MGSGLGSVQKRILKVLEELTKWNDRDWFSLLVVTISLYTPWQLNPRHPRNSRLIGGFIEDWSYGKNEKRRTWESCRALEKRGLIEIRIVRRNTWGGVTRYMEIKKR